MLFLASLSIKRDFDSDTLNFKAKLVAKGFQQEYGVDFDEIFSPTVIMTTLLFMLSVVATDDLEMIQLDMKTKFLHCDLEKEINMEQPSHTLLAIWISETQHQILIPIRLISKLVEIETLGVHDHLHN